MIAGLFIYVYIILGILVLWYDAQKMPQKAYDRAWMIVYVILALLAAFSYKVGPDTQVYMDMYDAMPKLSGLSAKVFTMTRSQPLYVLAMSLCKTIYDDFLSLQLLQIFLLYHSMYLLLKRLDLRKFWVLFLFMGYCYFALLSGRRECFGLSCCFYAMLFFLDKKWTPYYLLVLAGFLFHTGMIIFFVFPFTKLLKKMSLTNIIMLAVAVFLVQYGFGFIKGLSNVVNKDDSIMRYSMKEEVDMGFTTWLLITVELIIFIWFVVKGNSEKYQDYTKDLIYIGILSVMMSYLSAALPILYRYRAHFAVFQYFTLQESFRNTKKNINLVAVIFLVFCYSPISTFSSAMKTQNATYYYCSVFSSDSDKAAMTTMRNRNRKVKVWNSY